MLSKRPWGPRKCADCGKEVRIDDPNNRLYVRMVQWKLAGKGGRVIRSRNQKFQCQTCMEADPVFNQESYAGSRLKETNAAPN